MTNVIVVWKVRIANIVKRLVIGAKGNLWFHAAAAQRLGQILVLDHAPFQANYRVMPNVVIQQQRVLEFIPEGVSQVELRVI